MGEGSSRMNGSGDEPEPAEIEDQIVDIRAELDDLVVELDRRRHDAFDWRRQLVRHRRKIAIAAGVVALAVVGGVALRRRHRHGTVERARGLLHALDLLSRDPDALDRALRPHRPDALARSLLAAAGAAGLRAGANRLVSTD
jgi:hypothetical protein